MRQTTLPSYDDRTGRLKELTHDADGDGRIDTWTEMDGPRALRARIDRDHDGLIDRWEYYDEAGQLLKVGFSRAGDGIPDAWAYPAADGSVARVEVSSARREGAIDRWERYAPGSSGGAGILVAVEEDTTGDARPDRWETYEGGALRTVAFDEDGDGRPDRRLTYASGALILVESGPDGAGGFTTRRRVD